MGTVTAQEMPPYDSIKGTARIFHVGESCLRQRLKNGQLPGFYAGSRFYVNIALLQEQLERESKEMIKNG